MQYKNGIITGTTAAINLELGFVPDRFSLWNYTVLAAASATAAVGYSYWINGANAPASAFIDTYTSGAPVTTLITTNGFTAISGNPLTGTPPLDWYTTSVSVTSVSTDTPALVTLGSITPANGQTIVNGDTVTLSQIGGLGASNNLNENRYIVTGISGSTFKLYDTYGNPVTASGTFATGGICNVISTPALGPVLNATTGQVITPAQPPGNQYDTGYYGITIGTSVTVTGNTLYYEAFLKGPANY